MLIRFCRLGSLALAALVPTLLWAQQPNQQDVLMEHKFDQIDSRLPTPTPYRTGSGAPGHMYWQNRADYAMECSLDDATASITGKGTITYFNNSPDALPYLWLQLDQNIWAKGSQAQLAESRKMNERMSFGQLAAMQYEDNFDGGFKLGAVTDGAGKPLKYAVSGTMMRIDLPTPLRPGQQYVLKLDWRFNIPDATKLGGRMGYEPFPDGNKIYQIAQWFPRMAVYNDTYGWQHKQFLGAAEFTLPFGDYRVSINVPDDFIVGSTGEWQNADQVLTQAQRQRLAQARSSYDKPVYVVTPEEAAKNESSRSTGRKTWVFAAKNVRDFAFAASRKYAWDAMNVKLGSGRTSLAMSFFSKEGGKLWELYSTQSVAHTLRVYGKYSIEYPYPVAISANGPQGGMEYPMIAYNGGTYARVEADGTYSDRAKYGLISVVIHETGHNFFPMIVNSDERQWTWMDEGLNSFLQYLAEQEWEPNYPSRRGPPENMVSYMKAERKVQNPIMTSGDVIQQLGNNAYGKPATALNILRETVLGRELFDKAFKTFSERWAFKHPYPADFFRSMEDASAVDLDWFWRGWFYTTDNVDISLEDVKYFRTDTQDPAKELALARAERDAKPTQASTAANDAAFTGKRLVDQNPALKDFYTTYDPLQPQAWNVSQYQQFVGNLTEEEKALLNNGKHYYQLDFKNIGGLVMPIVLQLTYTDGSTEVVRLPAQIWQYNTEECSKILVRDKQVTSILVDPFRETADVDLENNSFPRRPVPSKFQLFKQQQQRQPNPMQLDARARGAASAPAAPAGAGK